MVRSESSLLIAVVINIVAVPSAPEQGPRKPAEEAEAPRGWSEGVEPPWSHPRAIAPHVAGQCLPKRLPAREGHLRAAEGSSPTPGGTGGRGGFVQSSSIQKVALEDATSSLDTSQTLLRAAVSGCSVTGPESAPVRRGLWRGLGCTDLGVWAKGQALAGSPDPALPRIQEYLLLFHPEPFPESEAAARGQSVQCVPGGGCQVWICVPVGPKQSFSPWGC